LVSPANPIVEANSVARAWASSALRDESIDDHRSILSLERGNHGSRDQLINNWDEPPFDDALWWDPALGYAPEALNHEHRGLRITDEYARMHALNGSEYQYFASDVSTFPRLTPMYLALFDRLREGRGFKGRRLPLSRVDPDVFGHLDEISTDTPFPLYDKPCDTSPESSWDEHLACRDSIQADATAFQGYPLAGEIAALHEFVTDNPLSRSTRRLRVPDVAAPLGYQFFVYAAQLRRDFNDAELAARYGSHSGYVRAVKDATDALVDDDLWDPKLGKILVRDARESDVLRRPARPTAAGPRAAGPPRGPQSLLPTARGARHGPASFRRPHR
jgi:hypothetical protein